MKKITILILLLSSVVLVNAQKYFTKTGFTEFKASVEAFEPVEAKNNSSTAVLNIETGEVAALMFIKAFKFKVALMEEHFNENYMDSDKYPKATFKGRILDFNFEDLNVNEKEFEVDGALVVRGVEKELNAKAIMSLVDEKIMVRSNFSVKPEDFGIEIPSIVSSKIAETININLEYELIKK